MVSRIYVGVYIGDERTTFAGEQTTIHFERFRSPTVPTHATHGDLYMYCIGPFRTVAGAEFYCTHGYQNPHCRCVADAEKLAKLKKQGKL